jgi:hypothetical protein
MTKFGWMKVGPDACARANQDVRSGASQETGVAIACHTRTRREGLTAAGDDLPVRLNDGGDLTGVWPEVIQSREGADRVGVCRCCGVDLSTGTNNPHSARRANHLTSESGTSTCTHNRDCAHRSREERLRTHVLSPFLSNVCCSCWTLLRQKHGVNNQSDHHFANPSLGEPHARQHCAFVITAEADEMWAPSVVASNGYHEPCAMLVKFATPVPITNLLESKNVALISA